jgi:hypothetical protein
MATTRVVYEVTLELDPEHLHRFVRQSVRLYEESLRQKGDMRNDGSTGRMNAKDVTISQGAFKGICQAADVLDLAWTSHQYRMWVREAYEAEDVPSVAAAYNNRVEVIGRIVDRIIKSIKEN